jgi:hypothetical protein
MTFIPLKKHLPLSFQISSGLVISCEMDVSGKTDFQLQTDKKPSRPT